MSRKRNATPDLPGGRATPRRLLHEESIGGPARVERLEARPPAAEVRFAIVFPRILVGAPAVEKPMEPRPVLASERSLDARNRANLFINEKNAQYINTIKKQRQIVFSKFSNSEVFRLLRSEDSPSRLDFVAVSSPLGSLEASSRFGEAFAARRLSE